MDLRLEELVDIKAVRRYLLHFAAFSGMGCTLTANPSGEIIIAAGWSDLCEGFHRRHPEAANRCAATRLAASGESGTAVVECPNGPMEAVIPVVVEGEHLANLVVGQILFQDGDRADFAARAQDWGFDRRAYLNALARVPVVEEARFRHAVATMEEVAGFVSAMALSAIKAQKLDEANNALQFLLQKTNEAREEIEKNVTANIKGLVMPHLMELEQSAHSREAKEHISSIKRHLKEIASPFSRQLVNESRSLTPREIQVAELVRLGRTNKEIATALGISPRTVESYRDALRRKLDLKNKKVNLRAYLMSMAES